MTYSQEDHHRDEQPRPLPLEPTPSEAPDPGATDEMPATGEARQSASDRVVGDPRGDASTESVLRELDDLLARGFSSDEALRLIETSRRIASSSEVRDEQALVRRLRFQRWLVEHGRLDEFTA